jgi:hypothetical protein
MKPESILRAELLLKCLRLKVDESAMSGPNSVKAEWALHPPVVSDNKSPETKKQPETSKQLI